jgi:hypothetical protein
MRLVQPPHQQLPTETRQDVPWRASLMILEALVSAAISSLMLWFAAIFRLSSRVSSSLRPNRKDIHTEKKEENEAAQ